jgi:hypothetical protein
MPVNCASDFRNEAASGVLTLKMTLIGDPPWLAATPRRPSEVRSKGMIASAPASPINPHPGTHRKEGRRGHNAAGSKWNDRRAGGRHAAAGKGRQPAEQRREKGTHKVLDRSHRAVERHAGEIQANAAQDIIQFLAAGDGALQAAGQLRPKIARQAFELPHRRLEGRGVSLDRNDDAFRHFCYSLVRLSGNRVISAASPRRSGWDARPSV